MFICLMLYSWGFVSPFKTNISYPAHFISCTMSCVLNSVFDLAF